MTPDDILLLIQFSMKHPKEAWRKLRLWLGFRNENWGVKNSDLIFNFMLIAFSSLALIFVTSNPEDSNVYWWIGLPVGFFLLRFIIRLPRKVSRMLHSPARLIRQNRAQPRKNVIGEGTKVTFSLIFVLVIRICDFIITGLENLVSRFFVWLIVTLAMIALRRSSKN